MTTEEKAKAYDEALKDMRVIYPNLKGDAKLAVEHAFPQLKESKDGRIRKELIEYHKQQFENNRDQEVGLFHKDAIAWLEKQKEPLGDISTILLIKKWIDERKEIWNKSRKEAIALDCSTLADDAVVRIEELNSIISFLGTIRCGANEKQKEQKPINMEAYEAGKGTTIFGQDYKCKKDYRSDVRRYIKDVMYHCYKDGYLTDQNGLSWSCTPEWFNEYIYTNNELADKEKNDFVSGQFLQCKLSFDGFKEGEHYWLEYVGDDMYVGRSDNVLNQKFHITPRQLFTLFSQKLEEVQGPPQEEKQVSLNYEPPFNENPSDREIVEALIKDLKEQDGFLTAIDCVSTKAILSWLKKQKEQKPAEKLPKEEYVKKFKALCDAYEIKLPNREYDIYGLCEDLHKLFGDIHKPAEWDELQAEFRSINEAFEDGKKEVIANPDKYGLCKPAERNKATINGEPIPTENHSVNIALSKEEKRKNKAEWSSRCLL